MISLLNVQKEYEPGQLALKGISFKIRSGEFVFIAGASGAGKSTLLRLLFGAERSSKGQVYVGGRNLSTIRGSFATAMLRREVGVVFQDYKLLTRRTVMDNVIFGLEVQGVKAEERRKLGQTMLKAVGLEHKANAWPLTLSGGEQQRVAIARALMTRPRLILADEPTGNLDHEMSQIIFNLLLQANELGVTVVVATHDLATIERLNKRTMVLDRGEIIGDFNSAYAA